jgi:hypothetical protein
LDGWNRIPSSLKITVRKTNYRQQRMGPTTGAERAFYVILYSELDGGNTSWEKKGGGMR